MVLPDADTGSPRILALVDRSCSLACQSSFISLLSIASRELREFIVSGRKNGQRQVMICFDGAALIITCLLLAYNLNTSDKRRGLYQSYHLRSRTDAGRRTSFARRKL